MDRSLDTSDHEGQLFESVCSVAVIVVDRLSAVLAGVWVYFEAVAGEMEHSGARALLVEDALVEDGARRVEAVRPLARCANNGFAKLANLRFNSDSARGELFSSCIVREAVRSVNVAV
jgi:hypothetical protein